MGFPGPQLPSELVPELGAADGAAEDRADEDAALEEGFAVEVVRVVGFAVDPEAGFDVAEAGFDDEEPEAGFEVEADAGLDDEELEAGFVV